MMMRGIGGRQSRCPVVAPAVIRLRMKRRHSAQPTAARLLRCRRRPRNVATHQANADLRAHYRRRLGGVYVVNPLTGRPSTLPSLRNNVTTLQRNNDQGSCDVKTVWNLARCV